jgi:prophage endopeptidase
MSLFNPWILLGLLVAFLSVGAGGYQTGKTAERERQQLEIAKLNEAAREKEQALVKAVHTQATQFVKVNNEAKILSQKRNTDIALGALKLRIPVKAPVCPVQTAGDPPAPTGDSVQATAEFDRETAQSLVAITDKGDENTRQLNACIDAYNTVYQTLKGQK